MNERVSIYKGCHSRALTYIAAVRNLVAKNTALMSSGVGASLEHRLLSAAECLECVADDTTGCKQEKKAPLDRELLLLKLRDHIADKEALTACANSELAKGGWHHDWRAMMEVSAMQAATVIKQLEKT